MRSARNSAKAPATSRKRRVCNLSLSAHWHPPMFNLAAFRYRGVMASSGGPVERLEMADVTVLGQREFLANAYLKAGLVGDRGSRLLYSPANGSGTSPSPMVARF